MMRWSLLLTATLLCAGCGDEKLNPAPLPNNDTGPTPTGGTPPPDAPPKRTIMTRNPFGGPPGNLLVDGDFEFSILFQGSSQQTGWVPTSDFGQAYLYGATGGTCRTGLRCALMFAGSGMFGRGTAARGSRMIAELWARPPIGSPCEVISQIYFGCSFAGNDVYAVPAVTEMPDEDGWCHYRSNIPEQSEAMCTLVQSEMVGTESAIIDSATLVPDDGTVVLSSSPRKVFGPEAARLRALTKRMRDRTPFGKPSIRPDPIP